MARVPITVGLELVRAMLRSNGAFCRLEAEDRFFVHVGFDQYVWVGSAVPCERSVALAHDRGLFAEPVGASPLAAEFADDTAGTPRPADAAWWARLASLVTQRGAVMLEEGYVLNASHWPDLSADVDAVVVRAAEFDSRSRLSA